MTPLNKEAAFASIAADLELFVPLLATHDRATKLAMLSNIGEKLVDANLTWRDVAERLATPQPAKAAAIPPYAPPPPYSPPMPSRAEPSIDPADAVAASDHGDFGYRQRGERLGHAPGTEIPGLGTMQPDGTVKRSG